MSGGCRAKIAVQPIETCWAVVKNYMADNCDFTMNGLQERLPEAFAKVTAETCRKIMDKVIQKEDQYWQEDEMLDEVYATDATDERLSEVESPTAGADPYLGEGRTSRRSVMKQFWYQDLRYGL